MKAIQPWFAACIFLFSVPAFAASASDPFQEVVAKYLAANPKPVLPEEARKYRVQGEFAIEQKRFKQAAQLYANALEIAPWWPAGYYNRALIMAELEDYNEAAQEMTRYLLLEPNSPDARALQDKIYQWESVAIEARQKKDRAAKRKVYENKDPYCRSWPAYIWPGSNHEQIAECEKLCVDAGGSRKPPWNQFSCSFE